MATGPTGPDFPPLSGDETALFHKLAGCLTASGVAQLVCSACLLVLALTGYETARKVNADLLILAFVLLMTGGASASAGRSLRRAVASAGDKLALTEAVRKLAHIHGTVMFLFALGAVALLVRTAVFLAQVVARPGGAG